MRIGVLAQRESYWSLDSLTRGAMKELGQRHDLLTDVWYPGTRENHTSVRRVFADSDVVLGLRSRILRTNRDVATPGVFLGHAWMDHGAGLMLHRLRHVFRGNDVFTFASSPAARKYQAIYPAGPRAVVLPYFVRTGPACSHTREEHADRFGLPRTARWIVYAGRLNGEKRTHTLVRLWREVHRGSDLLVLAGSVTEQRTFGCPPDPADLQVKEIADQARAGVLDGVRLLEGLGTAEVACLFEDACLAVTATLCLEEDFGLMALEAMATGLTVVAPDWGGIQDVVIHGVTGLLAPTSVGGGVASMDERAFVGALTTLLADEPLRRAMGAAARQRASTHFSAERFVHRTEATLRDALHGRIDPSPAADLHPIPEVAGLMRDSLRRNGWDRIYGDRDLFDLLQYPYATAGRATAGSPARPQEAPRG
jgi:glycosyltransferase involved in cell wall biosynthesis